MTPAQQLDALITERNALLAWLPKAKEREAELRQLIASMMFTREANGMFPEGTNNALVAGEAANYAGKLKAQVKREVLPEMISATWEEAQLTVDEAKDLLRIKYELGLTAYRKLPEEKRLIVDKMLVVKPGTLDLEVNSLPK